MEATNVLPRIIQEKALDGCVYMYVRHGNVWKDQGLILATEVKWHKEYWMKREGITGVLTMPHHYVIALDIQDQRKAP